MSQPHIAIIGAGHAGVEAAFALAKGGAKVTLLSDEPCLPYFRPRLIAVAFGQADPDAIAIKPQKAYDEAGIDLRHESATDVDPDARTVNGRAYDGLIVATGSRPFVPPFAGCRERALPLWTMADALAIRERFETARSVAIVGAGVLGIEAACRAATRLGAGRTRLIEPARAMLGGILGEDEQPLFRALCGLAELEPHIGCGVRDIGESALTLTDGTVVDADLVVILSDVDGLYTANPQTHPEATLRHCVEEITPEIEASAGGAGSSVGTGGMCTKIQAAKSATTSGINLVIASGSENDAVMRILNGEDIGTLFVSRENRFRAVI